MIFRNSLSRLKHFIPNNTQLSQVWGQTGSDISQDGLHIYYTGFARKALLKGLDLLEINSSDNVLVPAYICYSAIEPFTLRGIEVRYYKINKNFTADLEALNKLVDNNTKALLYVNYFGLMDNFEDYQDFCRNNGLYLIEDNAHLLLPDYRYAKGDISIYSLRKFYPVFNGAILVVRNSKKNETQSNVYECVEKKLHLADYKFVINALARRLYNNISTVLLNVILSKFKRKHRKSIPGYTAAKGVLYEKILASSFNIINNIDFQAIYIKRRDNYNLLLENLSSPDNKYTKVIFGKLGTDACPLAFPLLVERDRESFIRYLFINGYTVYPWPDMPDEIIANSQYKNEQFLSNSVVLLPIHEDIKEGQVERMALIIKKWAGKIDRKN